MSEVWKRWEGQVVDSKYQLQRCLGSTDHSVVFLAGFHAPEPRLAAVKFISADVPNAAQRLAEWKRAAELSHPNLLRIYGTGTCKLEDTDLLYVAMEYAEENLGEILPQRALQPEEAREVLNVLTDVLVFLQNKNLTHGHVKPSNILAQGDQLKISSDTIRPAGELHQMRRKRSPYDAPEIASSPCTGASDVWSLGVTLVEALTQQPAVLPFDQQAEPTIPPSVRGVFRDIAEHTLQRNPRLRWTIAQVAERLSPASATAAKAAVASAASASAVAPAPAISPAPPPMAPVSVPLSREPAVRLARQPQRPPSPAQAARPPVAKEPRQAIVLPNYVVPLFAGVLVLAAIIVLPKILHNRAQPSTNPVASSTTPAASSGPGDRKSPSAGRVESGAKPQAAPKSANSDSVRPVPKENRAATPKQPTSATSTAPAVLRSTESAASAKTRQASGGRGEVLDQTMPEPPAKALATIHGTVRVGVKVHVDAAGSVSDATLDSPGPSSYFADLSLKAAQRWLFSPPEADGRSVPSDWLVHFYYTQSGVKASSQQVSP